MGDVAFTLRPQKVGDLGWACERQATLYAQEFGYLPVFEHYVLRSVVPFLERFDPALDGLWVAEDRGRRLGCVAIQHDPDRAQGADAPWAKLRWFFVEKEARGQGVGKALLDHAVSFARRAGHRGLHLWTVDDLHDARRLYEKAGFRLVHTEREPCAWAPWGHEQRWELVLETDPSHPFNPRNPEPGPD